MIYLLSYWFSKVFVSMSGPSYIFN